MNLKHNMKIALALVVAVGSYLVASGNQCTCLAKTNGCIITVAAPINKACNCDYKDKLCGATVVNCTVPTACDCINPGTNLKSCLLGGGNCGGYNMSDQRQNDIRFQLKQEMGCQFASQDAVVNKPGPECDGSCVPIDQCPILKPVLTAAQNNEASALNKLRRSVCSQAGSQVKVCCPPDVRDPLPEICGENNGTARIVSGENAKLGQWPWMALLRMSAGDTHGWFCGGVLISARYVLTAAHCVVDSAYTIEFVRLGELVLNENPDSSGSTTAPHPQDIFVERIIGHPQYNQGCNKCNDIALLRLASPAKIDKLFPCNLDLNRGFGDQRELRYYYDFQNRRCLQFFYKGMGGNANRFDSLNDCFNTCGNIKVFVKPICISRNPARDGVSASNFRNLKAWVAGWGVSQENPLISFRPSILKTVQLPIQDLEFCRKRKQDLPNQNMIFCAGDGKQGVDTCRGDSGGPIMVASNNHVWYSIGVMSFGSSNCVVDGFQSEFTNINHYLPWIEENVHQ